MELDRFHWFFIGILFIAALAAATLFKILGHAP